MTDTTPEKESSVQHGTVNRYKNHGCKCGECRAAWAARCRDYRQARLMIPGLSLHHFRANTAVLRPVTHD